MNGYQATLMRTRPGVKALVKLTAIIAIAAEFCACSLSETDNANLPYAMIATIPTGKVPAAAALDPIDHLLYVSNLADASVSVIDTVTNRLVDTISVPTGPLYIGVHPGTHTAYVVCGGTPPDGAGHTVAIIRNRSHDVVRADTRAGAAGIAVDPGTNRAYVDVGGDSVAAIAGASATVLAEVSVGGGTHPASFAVDAGRGDIYAGLNQLSTPESILALDGTTMAVKSSITVGHASFAIARDDQSGRLFSVGRQTDSSQDNVLSVIDGTSVKHTATINEDILALVVDQSGNLVLAAPQNGRVVRFIDKHSGEVASTLLASDATGFPAVDSQTHKFYLPLPNKNQIVVLGPKTWN